MKIAVDAMGGDNGSKPIIEAIKEFKKDHQDVEIVVFGKEEELFELSSIARIVNAPDVVPMEAGALEVLRMKNSSMCKAVSTMKEEGIDAVISAGSTGGFLSAATLILKTIPGVKRSALVTAFPTKIKGISSAPLSFIDTNHEFKLSKLFVEFKSNNNIIPSELRK